MKIRIHLGFAIMVGALLAGCAMPPKSASIEALTVLKPFVGKTIVWHGNPIGDKGRWFLQTEYGAIVVDAMWDFDQGPKPFDSGSVVTVLADVVFVSGYTVRDLPRGLQANLKEGSTVAAHYLLTNVRVLEVDGKNRSAPIRVASAADLGLEKRLEH